MMQHVGRLTPLGDVLTMIQACRPVEARVVATTEAQGLVLAADALAPRALPATDTALRDGWAVSAEATRDAGPYAPLPLSPPPQRIDAFMPMPPGTDAVAPPDAVMPIGGGLQIAAPVAPGEGVLPQATDTAAGCVLVAAGRRLRRCDVAMLLAAGVEKLRVRVPRVRIVNTRPGVLEAATLFVAQAVSAVGASVVVEADGNVDGALRLGAADAVIGIGGTGSGRKDRSVIALSRAGKLHCHGVALSPGETAAFGQMQDRPVLLLPGRLDATIACWLALGQALIARLAGADAVEATQPVRLARKVTSSVGIAEFVPLRMAEDGVVPLASGFISLQQLSQADGWILLPAESEGYPAGTVVPMRRLP